MRILVLLLASLLLVAGIKDYQRKKCPKSPSVCTSSAPLGTEGRAIVDYINSYADANNFTSVLYRVTRDDGKTVIAGGGYGTTLTGVPVTGKMHYRNGNIAYAYVGQLLLLLQEAGILRLTDKASRYLPEISFPAGSEDVTLEDLAKSSSGFRDYVPNAIFAKEQNDNPFQQFSPLHLIDIGFQEGPLLYAPGTGWNYAHTNFMLLGMALERAGGESLNKLLNRFVLKPLNLPNTAPTLSIEVPQPVLHTYTNERNVFEESTYWNPSWFSAPGSVVTTTICDVATSAVGVGTGCLLSRASYEKFIGFTNYTMPPDCDVCRVFTPASYYGVGVFVKNGWISANPKFGGTGQMHAYLPSAKLAIALIYSDGPFTNDTIFHSGVMFDQIAAILTK